MSRFFFFFFILLLFSSCYKQTDVDFEVIDVGAGLEDAVQIYLLDYLDTQLAVWDWAPNNQSPSGYCIDRTYYNTNASKENYSQPFFEDSAFLAPKIRGGRGSNSPNQEQRFLQAHTCYPNFGSVSVHQGFDVFEIKNKLLKFSFYNDCVEAVETRHSSSIILQECDKNPKQQFVFESDGKIKPVDDLSLCLTVSYSLRATGGVYHPLYLLRDLSLRSCSPTLSSRQTWGLRTAN